MFICKKVSQVNYIMTFEDLESFKKENKTGGQLNQLLSGADKKKYPIYQENKGFVAEKADLTNTIILDINNLKESFA